MISLGLTLLILGVLAVARLQPVPRLFDLPQAYLPGSLPPQGMTCPTLIEDTRYRWYEVYCSVIFQSHQVYFEFDGDYRRIARTILPLQDYTLGQLIVSWRTPSGIKWNNYTVYVYWAKQWMILDSDSFGPFSPVMTIIYKPEQSYVSSWQGFRRPAQR